MNIKKKVFIIVSVLFIAMMVYFAYDLMSRTTAPWEKKEEIIKKYKVD
ncbi:MAG: hypothetical protein RH860_14290 [Cytophagales bacterium]